MLSIGVAIFSMVLAWSGALLIAKRGIAWGFADIPNERSSHISIVPRGGGVGIPLAAALTSFFLAPSQLLIASASILISMTALLNDKREFPVGFRLAVEAIVAGVLVYPVFLMVRTSKGQSYALLILAISILYIVAQANIFNFMDGINGIAAIEAMISFALLGIHAQLTGKPDIVLICVAVVAGAIGFFPLNFPRAKVFMGDVGSVYLGFLFAAMIMVMAKSFKEFLALALFQGVFSIDGTMTIVRRAIKKQNIFRAHRQHLYQLLVHSGAWSHAKTALVYGAVQTCFGLTSLFIVSASLGSIISLWSCLLITYLVGEYLASRVPKNA
jgi:Fuc2NAc and GlcNAc transferase